MKRFTWWRMEQDAHHLSHALCGLFCSILHHVKRFMSQPPKTPKSTEKRLRELQRDSLTPHSSPVWISLSHRKYLASPAALWQRFENLPNPKVRFF